MVKNNVSVNLVNLKLHIKNRQNGVRPYHVVVLKKRSKSVSDTGNPYHVACLSVDTIVCTYDFL